MIVGDRKGKGQVLITYTTQFDNSRFALPISIEAFRLAEGNLTAIANHSCVHNRMTHALF